MAFPRRCSLTFDPMKLLPLTWRDITQTPLCPVASSCTGPCCLPSGSAGSSQITRGAQKVETSFAVLQCHYIICGSLLAVNNERIAIDC